MRIIIDPLYNALYASFYLKALLDKFGKQAIVYSGKPFASIKERGYYNFDFIMEDNGITTNYSIDHSDSNTVLSQSSYDWCDVYGKVNTNWQITPKAEFPKIVSLCPSFGVRALGGVESLIHLLNLLIFKTKQNEIEVRKFIGKHKRLYQNRLFYEQYAEPVPPVEEHYLFHLSTLWYNDEWNKNDEGVNRVRAEFIRACRSVSGLRFEGGLLPQKNSSETLFADVLYRSASQLSIKEYVAKTKRSVFVFNTPSFWGCHGWKLGEYLAMGKAIISTPLSNDLPAPLEHGNHIHIVENASYETFSQAIHYLLDNPDYRKKLERGAREYWQRYGTPEKSLDLLGIKRNDK